MKEKIKEAANLLKNSNNTTAFTGSGISVESGIPSFRGPNGLWNKYDPKYVEISYFLQNPKESWLFLKEIFFTHFGKAKPNFAHKAIAELEKKGIVKAIITQNIDNLHQEAGSKIVYEFHGNLKYLICLECGKSFSQEVIDMDADIPFCKICDGLLKPDCIFFGEPIPEPAGSLSFALAENSDIFLIVGTTGEVTPACNIPHNAKSNGAKIIEINPYESSFTNTITDVFLQGKATEMMKALMEEIAKYTH